MVPTKVKLPASKLQFMREYLRNNRPCFETLADLESDLIVKAFAPLEEAPHDLPRFPTWLECLEADRAIKWWGTLSQVTCTRTLGRTHACTQICARIPPAKPHLDMHVHESPLPKPTLTCTLQDERAEQTVGIRRGFEDETILGQLALFARGDKNPLTGELVRLWLASQARAESARCRRQT